MYDVRTKSTLYNVRHKNDNIYALILPTIRTDLARLHILPVTSVRSFFFTIISYVYVCAYFNFIYIQQNHVTKLVYFLI